MKLRRPLTEPATRCSPLIPTPMTSKQLTGVRHHLHSRSMDVVTIGGAAITCAAGSLGFNAIARTCDSRDDHDHGTHVFGTIAPVGNNGADKVKAASLDNLQDLQLRRDCGEWQRRERVATQGGRCGEMNSAR